MKETMLMKRPRTYESAVAYARLKNATSSTGRYDELLKKMEALVNNNTKTVAVNFADSTETSRDDFILKIDAYCV